MCKTADQLASSVDSFVRVFDASGLGPEEAARLVEVFARAERRLAAARTIAAGRVQDSRAWRSSGHRTAAEWMASRTQSRLSDAIATLHTARALSDLPATRAAFVSGRLSEVQAAEITAAASADPASESSLLSLAENTTVAQLREECRVVRAAAASDEDANERIRRGRYLRHWSDRDGAVRLDGRFAPDDGARLVAAVTARADEIAADARRSGQREPLEAHAADALLSLCDGEPGPRGVVHVQVDHSAWERGRTVAGETCRIPGVGPIPVTSARQLAGDGIVKAIVTDGIDVTRVAHLGRTIPAHVRTALEVRDPSCAVPGCDVRRGLEIDHVVPFAQGGPTRLSNLARLCRYHHAQKTHHGWQLGGEPGAWTWTRASRLQARRSSERSPPRRPP